MNNDHEQISDLDIALIGATAICWAGAFALAVWYGAMLLGVAP